MIELKNEKGSVFVSDTALSSITGAVVRGVNVCVDSMTM